MSRYLIIFKNYCYFLSEIMVFVVLWVCLLVFFFFKWPYLLKIHSEILQVRSELVEWRAMRVSKDKGNKIDHVLIIVKAGSRVHWLNYSSVFSFVCVWNFALIKYLKKNRRVRRKTEEVSQIKRRRE